MSDKPDTRAPTSVLAMHYTNVVTALNESRKEHAEVLDHPENPDTALFVPAVTTERIQAMNAIDTTIKGVCQLIDALVAHEHRALPRISENH